MLDAHVLVNALTSRECRQTLPANVRLAARARHVVAPFAALDRHLAPRTALDVVVRRPLIKELVLRDVPLLARHPIVVLNPARGTDAS